MTISHLSEREKDVQILLLRQQLRIVERKQPHARRLPRWQKLTLALLAGRIQRRGKAGQAKLREVSLLLQPQTLLKWHREAVRRKWTFKRKGQVGRPRTDAELEALVVRLARENPDWGHSRYYNERRPHQGLDGATPLPLDVPAIDAPIRRRDILGGITHDYYRAA
jgi:putative transposase